MSRRNTPAKTPRRRTISELVTQDEIDDHEIASENKEAERDEIQFSDLKFGDKLAEGGFGEIYRGEHCCVYICNPTFVSVVDIYF